MNYIAVFVGAPVGVYLLLLAANAIQWNVWGAGAVLTAFGTWLLAFAIAGFLNMRGR